MSTPTLIVVGGTDADYRAYCMQSAADRYPVVLIDAKPPSWQQGLVVDHEVADTRDPAAVTAAGLALAERHTIAGVVTWDEYALVPAAALAARLGLPGSPVLTVVGVAESVSRTSDAWVVPAQIPALRATGTTPAFQMLYRFAQAGTDAQVAANRTAVAAALPTGSVTGAQSYLDVKLAADGDIAPIVPFVVAFGVLGLVMSDSPVRFAGPTGLGRWGLGRPVSRWDCDAGELGCQIGDGSRLPDYGLRDRAPSAPVERVCQFLHFRWLLRSARPGTR